ncbi:hypothetical protein BV378_01785 [Nostoc sp. RF31YmG]|jgi:hypothetical protein|nr:hypothetical protein BV378_01785 [Nostoc sp. RF31YmG]
MKFRRFLIGARFWFWVVAFVAYSAAAVGIVMIDTADIRYQNLSQVHLTSVKSDEQVRRMGAAQVAALYRAQSGMPFASLPPGATFQIVWPDGSTETVTVVDPASSTGNQLQVGSQQATPAVGAN